MIRNEKTGRFEASQKEAEYGYYSKVLNKPFDSLDELKKAEEEHVKAEEEKKQASLAKKADASKVEEAWKALNAANKDYNEKVTAAKREYVKAKSDAANAYNSVINEQDALVEKAKDAYYEALDEFNKAHPEGYHMTLRDGDTVKTISRNNVNTYTEDFFNKVFDLFSRF